MDTGPTAWRSALTERLHNHCLVIGENTFSIIGPLGDRAPIDEKP